jgi:hypothetical protein
MGQDSSPSNGAAVPSGCPAPAPAPTPSPAPTAAQPSGCPTCKGEKKHKVVVSTTQLLFGVFTKSVDLDTGQNYQGVGLAFPPAFSTSAELAVVSPAPGMSANDVITGPSAGLSAALGEGIAPSMSLSANSAGTMLGTGATVGLESGATGSATYTWATPPAAAETQEDMALNGGMSD